jgi:hypothetical protein
MIRGTAQSAAYAGGHMVFKIYRAGDLHNKRGKSGIFNVGRTHFYEVIEPRLEKICLGNRAVGYTDRSVERVQAEMIAEGAAARITKTARSPSPAQADTASNELAARRG